MSSVGVSNLRINDLGGGMNTLLAPTAIQDKQFAYVENFQTDGNKLVSIPGYESIISSVAESTGGIKGMGTYGDYLFVLTGQRLVTYKNLAYVSDTDTSYTFASPQYNVQILYASDIYLIITDKSGTDNLRIIKYVPGSGYFDVSLTSAPSNLKFRSSGFDASNNRLYFGNNADAPSSVYFSQPGSPTTAGNIAKYFTIDGARLIGDGRGEVTGFFSRQDTFYAFTNDSVYKLTGDDVTTGPIFKKETGNGNVSQSTICPVAQDIFYFDGFNVRRLSYESNTLALKDSAISEEIKNEIAKLPDDQSKAVSYFSYPFYKLHLRTIDSAYNNVAFVYSVITKSWTIQTGVVANCSSTQYYQNKVRTYFGSPYLPIVYEDSVGNAYDWGNVNCVAYSKEYGMGDNVDYKRYYQVEFNGRITEGLEAYIDLIVDGKVVDTRRISQYSTSLGTTIGTSTFGSTTFGWAGEEIDIADFYERYEMYDDGRRFQFTIRYNGIGYLELQGFNLQYKAVLPYDTHY